MKKLYRWFGSLQMAIVLLVSIGTALAFGTRHEALYGTPAAQHYFYRAVWFQILLVFLAINLVISALRRLPWKKRHIGFVMTHLGIITILTGNLLGIWFGVEGTLFIPEGDKRDQLELAQDLLFVQSQNPGTPHSFPLSFNIRPWVNEVDRPFEISSDGRPLKVTVDRYFPNALLSEKVVEGEEESPAVRLELSAPDQAPQEAWLFSRDPERFGFRWGEAHVLFFEVKNDEELEALVNPQRQIPAGKGVLRLEFPERNLIREIPVEAHLGTTLPVEGTPYTLSLKDYFPDFMITDEGPKSRTEEPHNPALSFILKGPEGEDRFLVFALHPEFEQRHGLKRAIPVKATYEAPTVFPSLPPSLVGIVRSPTDWRVVLSSPDGTEYRRVPLALQEVYSHPWHDLSFRVLEQKTHGKIVESYSLKDRELRSQAIHLVVEQGGEKEETWLAHRQSKHIHLDEGMVMVSYEPLQRPLPFSVTLVDFRKKEYPGTTIASDFESDLEIQDEARGLHLSRKISMNNPLTYRGYTMFQSSFIEGPVETTILSVRKDPGTPVVYTGFITVIVGMMLMMFWYRRKP